MLIIFVVLFTNLVFIGSIVGGTISGYHIYKTYTGDISYEINDDGTCTVTSVKNYKNTSIIISEKYKNHTVTSISPYAFQNCSTLESVELPSTIKEIGDGAFRNCTSLKEIQISYGVITIGNYAFENCKSLKDIVIPSSVKSMGYNVFVNCYNLKIHCVAKSEPSSWGKNWNAYGCPVYYGYLDED